MLALLGMAVGLAAGGLNSAPTLPSPPLSDLWGPQQATLQNEYVCGKVRVRLEVRSGPESVRILALLYDGAPAPAATLLGLNSRLEGYRAVQTLAVRCNEREQIFYVQAIARGREGESRAVTLRLVDRTLIGP